MFHIHGIINGKECYIGGNDGYPVTLEVGGNKYSGNTESLQVAASKATGDYGHPLNLVNENYLEDECAACEIATGLFDIVLSRKNDYNVPGRIY
jgi:hypothetical protein